MKTLADLIKNAPTFKGEKEHYYMYRTALRQFIRRHRLMADPELVLEVALSSCKEAA